LAQGVLTGKYRGDAPPERDTRAGDPRVNQFIGRHLTPATFERVEALRRLAEQRGVRAGQLALAWCLRRREVSSVIVGATSVAQLQENLGAVELELGADEQRVLDDTFPPA
jgi:aryl-alcohol dehydrogenase-like predicted oxidoreductase